MKLKANDSNWDLVVIGGGITGAGILREAVRNGFKTLLVEQNDYAWGTSSRSSKLVHGGLRYLKEGKFKLTHESVKERERLLKEAKGLVEPLDFLLPIYSDKGPGKWAMEAGLSIYDIIARKWRHKYYDKKKFMAMEAGVNKKNLLGGFCFMDAQVDDSRLVLRLIKEAENSGGTALNYTRATTIIRNDTGHVTGIELTDVETGESRTLTTGLIINATGVWAERLHPSPEKGKHLRPLRGSHLIFSAGRIPVTHPVSFFNPDDGRPLFVIPWEGGVLLGTTDLDHDEDLLNEPSMTRDEASYLVNALNSAFPELKISVSEAISSFAGVRPVVSEGRVDPSKESREHVVWVDKGLVTVTGGKLTTFRALAWDTLKKARSYLRQGVLRGRNEPVFDPVARANHPDGKVSGEHYKRLCGRYGRNADQIVDNAAPEDLGVIPGTFTLWAELRFVAEHESINHLDDLLLRRVRVGMLVPNGGQQYMDRIKALCKPVLPWSDEDWEKEINRYNELWNACYSVPA